VEIWHTPEVDIAAFERANAQTTYRPGSGLAGEVWQTGEPKWIANLEDEPPFPNARIAINAGMGSAFGVPIKVGDEVQHVLEFFSPKIALPDPELLQTLGAIGSQLGHLIERKNADEALRKSEMRKAAILRSALDCIISFNADGKIIEFNPAAELVFGYSRAEACGRSIIDLTLPEAARETFRRDLAEYVADPGVQRRRGRRLELRAMRRDGTEFPADAAISSIAIDGRVMFTTYLRDITERKHLEEELLQSQKMEAVGRLAGGIAHDFNNILTAILGYSDLIMGKIDEREWMYKHLAEIRKSADFAASLTHQLLAFSRRQPLYLRVFNINDTVSSLQKMLQRVIGEHIEIKTHFNAQIGRLKADPSQLDQVLLNLCVNARDAMPSGGTITISTEDVSYFIADPYATNDMPAGPYVRLRVADTGCGMPPEVIKHIFEPFFTTKEKGQGTGLGLATCYGIVKQSGGYIIVDSAVDEGTTFTIYLPRVEETGEKAVLRKPDGELPGGSETILYVEDEISVRSLTAHVLRRLGYTVLEAADGKGARDLVEACKGGVIDLLFSDVVLPDAGGKDLSNWIRSRSTRTKVLLTSGYADENILRRHGVEGDTAFLQKPFTPLDLAKKVRETMDDFPES
jgi:PAS domain S-box-containing protein